MWRLASESARETGAKGPFDRKRQDAAPEIKLSEPVRFLRNPVPIHQRIIVGPPSHRLSPAFHSLHKIICFSGHYGDLRSGPSLHLPPIHGSPGSASPRIRTSG